MAESLTSYFRQVAIANHTTPCQIAIGKVFNGAAAMNADFALIRKMGMNCVRQRVGGEGSAGAAFAQAFARLVGQPGVERLHFQTTFPSWSLAGALRSEPCWCPDCLTASPVPYTPAAWEMVGVTVCTVHRRKLVSTCPNCGVIPRHTTLTNDALRCPKCGFDRRNSQAGDEASATELSVANRIQALIASVTAGAVPRVTDAREWATDLMQWALTQGCASTRETCRRLGITPTTIAHWVSGRIRPQLAQVLSAGLGGGITLPKLFSGNWAECRFAEEEPINTATARRRRPSGNIDAVVEKLRELAARNPAPSLTAVAEELKISPHTLKRLAPDDCEEITKRWNEHRQSERERKFREFCTRVDNYVSGCAKEGRIPSYSEVARQFPNSAIFLFPAHAAYVKNAVGIASTALGTAAVDKAS